jgi:hypothetical protein
MPENPPQTLQLDQPVSMPTPQASTPAPTQDSGAPPQTLQLDQPVNSSTYRQPVAGEDASGILGLGVGVAKGAMDTVQGSEALINHLLPANHQIPIINQGSTGAENASQGIGKFGEATGEWASGLEGLEGLSKVAKFAELAERIPGAAKTMALMDKYPFLAKMAEGVTKGAAVGGAQGAVKGAAEGKAKEGAEGGALGGAVGEGVVAPVIESAVAPLAEAIGDKFGIGTSSKAEAVRGGRPGKRNYRFAQDFQNAAPLMDNVEAQFKQAGSPAQSVEDWADRAGAAREILYKQKIAPLVAKNALEPLGGMNIAKGIQDEIPDAMKEFKPEEAAKMEQIANSFLQKPIRMENAEAALQHFNAELSATGYWRQLPAEREALLKTNGQVAGYKYAADSIRDEFYGRLNQLEPNSNIAKLKQDYGALRNVENEFRGRVNVNDRQSPINLKETLGAIMGIGTGGFGGAAIAALPFADRIINSPENMIARGVQKAARPGEEGIIAKGVQKAGKAAKGAATTLAGPTASGLGRILFTDSQGATHSIPDDAQALAHAQTIDPGLKVIQ